MSHAYAPAAINLGKTESCKSISYHFSMGIGRMRQIATKVVQPNQPAVESAVKWENAVGGTAVVVTTAKASELRHQKRLIDSPELDEIRSQDSKLQVFIKSQSASAGHESTRFVLNTEVESIYRAMEGYRTIRRPKLVAEFMEQYRKLEAVNFEPLREVLGDQFDRSDYRPSDEVEAGFTFTYTIRNVGAVQLTGLPSFIIDQEVAKEREERATAVEEFKGILRLTFKKLLDTLVDTVKPQIDGKKRAFYDSSVENLLKFVSNYAKQDMANDAETQAIVANVKKILTGVTPDMLRESDSLKVMMHEKLNSIKSQLDTMVQTTGRKFR